MKAAAHRHAAPAALPAAMLCALLAATPACAEQGTVSLTVSGSTIWPQVTVEAVASRLASYVNGWYGGVLEVVSTGAPAAIRVTLAPTAGGLSARTELARGAARTSRLTTISGGSLASLVPAVACDMASLWSASEGFANLPLSPPPALAAVLSTDTLAWLTGWNGEDLEPLGITGSDGSIAVAFPHGWVTLGPLFSVVPDTARDLLAQGLGREPLQVSAAVRVRPTAWALLSEREGKIAWIDTRLATRTVRDAPGLAAGRAERLGPGLVAVLSPAGPLAWAEDGAVPRPIGPAGGIASAFTVDGEGNSWVYDAGQGRIRVLSPQGREVFSIRPVARSAALQFPQQIAVFDDGSFLLGGAGEVWKFRATGIPVWRLDRIPGTVAEALPATFQLAVDRRAGSFVLLDGPSRRLLAFAPAGAAAPGASAPGDGLLLALQEAARSERTGDAGDLLPAARLALLMKKASLFAELAAGFQAEFLSAQEENALLRVAEAAREILAEDPADSAAARLLESASAARRRAREALAQGPAAVVSGARGTLRAGTAGLHVEVQVAVRNARPFPLSRLRVSATLPGLSLMPSIAEAGPLRPGKEQSLALTLPLAEPFEQVGSSLPASALLAWEAGTEGGATTARFTVEVAPPGPADATALREGLLLSTDPDDPLVRAVLAEMAGGAEDRLAGAAALLDALGRMRQSSPDAPGASGASEAAGVPTAALPGRLAGRAALRSLSADPRQWCLLTADALGALGFPVGFLSWPGAAVVLVDTGIPLAAALAGMPGLARDQAMLAKLSRDGRLCVPLSGAVPPPSSTLAPSVFALLEGLRASRENGVLAGSAAWVEGSRGAAPAAPVPPPFPLRLPVVTERLDRDTLAARIRSELEKHR